MLSCRICKNTISHPFFSLGNMPLANSFLSEADLKSKEEFYPLDVYFCNNCSFMQINEVKTIDQIFSHSYAYYSSYSETWLRHCATYAKNMIARFKLNPNSLVMEIASNDGYLLQFFREKNISVHGIEPASNVAQVAIKEKQIPTDIAFFNTKYAQTLKDQGVQADFMIANNVLAHTPHLNDFVEGFKMSLKPTGIGTLEFPHLLNLLTYNQFDTIYHEHFSYFSLISVEKLFQRHGLKIFDVDEIPTHGGSLRIYVAKENNATLKISNSLNKLKKKELDAGITQSGTYTQFKDNVVKFKPKFTKFLKDLKRRGGAIVGYGAPAKGNTLLNYCGITSEIIPYTVDSNPHKQMKFLPGTHILVRNPKIIKENKPKFVLILPWNIKEEITHQLNYIREWGGRFIVPIPEPVII